MNLRQAAEMALDSLDTFRAIGKNWEEPDEKAFQALRAALAEADDRKCTCHPDDNPPQPCPKKFALGECRQAAALAEAKEPVAWMDPDGNTISHAIKATLLPTFAALYPVPLYTHPPRREPMTEEEVEALIGAQWSPDLSLSDLCRDVARAVERAHGIGTDE